MRRSVVTASLLVVLGSMATARAEHHHKEWFKFLAGAWNYDWSSEVGGYSEKGEVENTIAAGGNVVLGRITKENGDKEVEIWGWQSDTKTMALNGFSSNGSCWAFNYTDVGTDTMRGTAHGVSGEGKSWEGNINLTKKGKNFEVRFEGTEDGEKSVSVGKVTRRDPNEKFSEMPDKVLKELSFMVGRWENVPSGNDGPVKTLTDERKWAPGKHCLLITWSGERDGVKLHASAIAGWNQTTNQVTEHWYVSDGTWSEVCYPVDEMKDGVWSGTMSWLEPSGQKVTGTCRLEKGKDEFAWSANWMENGEERSIRSITRKARE